MNKWPYSTSRWQKMRLVVLRREPLCRYCAEQGRTTAAAHVDHIQPVTLRRELAFVASNLQPLCESCHNGIKQREERLGYRVGCDVNGLPLRGW